MKVHISGVCGTATASLAGLLRLRGHEVTGSDQDVYPPMSSQLQELGIPVRSPYAAASIPEVPAMLLTYDFSDLAEATAVAALAGEIPIGGRLPISIPGLWPVGHGLTR